MLEIKDLVVHYKIHSPKLFRKETVRAVENASIIIPKNATVGLVGESGCGKSTLGKAILGLIPIVSGSVLYQGKDLTKLSRRELLPFRKDLQIIFQDPYSSLNPRLTIYEIITEGLFVHGKYSRSEALDLCNSILGKVGLGSEILYRYPHEFSGGQRQRISIARSLILSPSFIVCDEITSALDVSNQAQVINLLLDLRATFELSLLFISHDLNVVGFISDYIAVMYLGKIVEFGSKTQILSNPLHPYTQALFGSSFDINKRKQKKQILSGEIPGILEKPRGCYFHTRCPLAKEVCKNEIPIWKKNSENHYTACHFT